MSHHGREGLTEEQSFGPAAPELPEGWSIQGAYLHHLGWSLHLGQLRALLAAHGLSIVDAKDVLTPEERAVRRRGESAIARTDAQLRAELARRQK